MLKGCRAAVDYETCLARGLGIVGGAKIFLKNVTMLYKLDMFNFL